MPGVTVNLPTRSGGACFAGTNGVTSLYVHNDIWYIPGRARLGTNTSAHKVMWKSVNFGASWTISVSSRAVYHWSSSLTDLPHFPTTRVGDVIYMFARDGFSSQTMTTTSYDLSTDTWGYTHTSLSTPNMGYGDRYNLVTGNADAAITLDGGKIAVTYTSIDAADGYGKRVEYSVYDTSLNSWGSSLKLTPSWTPAGTTTVYSYVDWVHEESTRYVIRTRNGTNEVVYLNKDGVVEHQGNGAVLGNQSWNRSNAKIVPSWRGVLDVAVGFSANQNSGDPLWYEVERPYVGLTAVNEPITPISEGYSWAGGNYLVFSTAYASLTGALYAAQRDETTNTLIHLIRVEPHPTPTGDLTLLSSLEGSFDTGVSLQTGRWHDIVTSTGAGYLVLVADGNTNPVTVHVWNYYSPDVNISLEVPPQVGVTAFAPIILNTTPYQYVQPIADVSVGNWREAPLFEKIDEEVASDADYIFVKDPDYGASTVALSAPAEVPAEGELLLQLRVRSMNLIAGDTVSLQAELLQGDTPIATSTFVDFDDTYSIVGFVITAAERAAVTDWSALRVRVTGTVTPAP